MNYQRLLLTLFFLGLCLTVKADYNFNPRCIEAYNAIFDLRLNDARAIIAEEKKLDPQNGITVLLDNYLDYFSLLTSDNKGEYQRLLKANRSDRIDAVESNDDNTPWCLYTRAEIYLQWGLLKGRFGDYMSSASDLKKARNLLNDNEEKFPGFLPDQKSLALINVVFGALPTKLKTAARFLGMEGNVQTGVSELERLREQIVNTKYSFYSDELIFFLCYMDIDVLHNKNNFNKLMGYLTGMDNKSMLKAYLKGYIAAKTAHNDEAIAYLQAIPHSAQYLGLPLVDYFLACAKLCRMDTDTYVFFVKYINEYKGENFIKDSYLKLAYFYLLKNDQAKYAYYLKLARTKGYDVDEKDKQALKEANDVPLNYDLIKTRLYFDGGYYSKGLAQLADKKESDFPLLRDKIMYNYYMGRLYDRTTKYNDAISWYQKAINLGKNTSYYFSANAALSTGQIYEHIKDFNQAANYYKLVLTMHSHEYQSSIDEEAKDGLQRINR